MTDDVIYGPVYNIPEHLVRGYTMDGQVPIITHFFYQTCGGELNWTNQSWDIVMNNARLCIDHEVRHSYDSDPLLIRLMKRHSIVGKTVLIVGSEQPYYEALVTQFGGIPTTVEYRKINHDIPGLKTYTVEEFEKTDLQFDCALSVSSLEHSGLGRYGDPLDPEGDFKSMNLYRERVKKGGEFFLQVPVGQDVVAWNAHRIYGRARLPQLLNGWEVLDAEGFDTALFSRGNLGDMEQPAFYLRNP